MSNYLLDDNGNVLTDDSGNRLAFSALYSLALAAGSYVLSGAAAGLAAFVSTIKVHFRHRRV